MGEQLRRGVVKWVDPSLRYGYLLQEDGGGSPLLFTAGAAGADLPHLRTGSPVVFTVDSIHPASVVTVAMAEEEAP